MSTTQVPAAERAESQLPETMSEAVKLVIPYVPLGPSLNPKPGFPVAKVLSVIWNCNRPFVYAVMVCPTIIPFTTSPVATPYSGPLSDLRIV